MLKTVGLLHIFVKIVTFYFSVFFDEYRVQSFFQANTVFLACMASICVFFSKVTTVKSGKKNLLIDLYLFLQIVSFPFLF